jgi:uncharacterized protein (DUF1015 family)
MLFNPPSAEARKAIEHIRITVEMSVLRMVSFSPFHGLVPKLEKGESIGDRVSPPYDVIGPGELKVLQGHDFNVTKITLGAKNGDYAVAAEELGRWIDAGKLALDSSPCYYLYEQSFLEGGKHLTRTGIMGALKVEPYGTGAIVPHEETFPKIKDDRLHLLEATSAHLESIFCLCDNIDTSFMAKMRSEAKALFEMTDNEGVEHRFSRIADKALVSQTRDLMSTKRLLIADGHHRYETALRYAAQHPDDEKKQFVLATIVASNDPGMVVRPTHRLIKGAGAGLDGVLNDLVGRLNVWETGSLDETLRLMAKAKSTTFGLWLGSGRTLIAEETKPIDPSALSSVDAFVAEKLILDRILATSPDAKVGYDHDIESVKRKMATGTYEFAVLLNPPDVEAIWRVAAEGKKMPKKSTYFWPKIWAGFVVYPM